MGVSMLALSAASHSSRPHSRKSPGGGPPALLTRMSISPATESASARPASVVMSQHTVRTSPDASARASAAAASRVPAVRPFMVTCALRGKRQRAALAEPLARRTHQCPSACNSQFHALVPRVAQTLAVAAILTDGRTTARITDDRANRAQMRVRMEHRTLTRAAAEHDDGEPDAEELNATRDARSGMPHSRRQSAGTPRRYCRRAGLPSSCRR